MARRPKNIEKALDTTLFCYVEKENALHAKKYGRHLFGSFSAYVNALIAKDRGVQPAVGTWQPKEKGNPLIEKGQMELPGITQPAQPTPNNVVSIKKGEKLPASAPMGGPGTYGYKDPVV